jgi:hypothetical protein
MAQGYGSIAITSENDDLLQHGKSGGHQGAERIVKVVKSYSRWWWIIGGTGLLLSLVIYSVRDRTFRTNGDDSMHHRFQPDDRDNDDSGTSTRNPIKAKTQNKKQQHMISNINDGDDSYDIPEVAADDDVAGPGGLELFFTDQLADHFIDPNLSNETWPHRYYTSEQHWGGPVHGHPIFVIMGGEGSVRNILYPFVSEVLAAQFHGYVLQTEHRFYGKSQPNNKPMSEATNEELRALLSPEQAMADYVRLLRYIQDDLGCSTDRTEDNYCPVVTVGASYPGFLAAMMRFVYSDVVDVAYASSAPLPLYAQLTDEYVYFDKITSVAEAAVPGCAAAVQQTLLEMQELLLREEDDDGEEEDDDETTTTTSQDQHQYQRVARKMGICVETLPAYITDMKIFRNAVSMTAATSFADFNMAYYPPNESQDLVLACRTFQNDNNEKKEEDRLSSALEKIKAFYQLKNGDGLGCFDLRTEVPEGANATVSGADWSGVGDGNTGRMWDFQTCRDLVVHAGFGKESMFIPRKWTLAWLTEHCETRFGVTPAPYHMVDMWGFDDLVGNGGSYMLFTNGLNDGWSVASHLEDLSDTILALNFPNGAHHSDLGHDWPLNDTKDIEEGHDQIIEILGGWLNDLYGSDDGVDDDDDDDESSTSKDDDDESSTSKFSAKDDDPSTLKSSSRHHSTPSLRSNP